MRAASLLVILAFAPILAAEDPEHLARQFELEVQPLLQTYCVDCHSGDEPEGSLSLEFSRPPEVPDAFEKWTVVLQRVAGNEMPPEDAEQPTDAERQLLARWIDAGLENFDCTQEEAKPRATVRRLNRVEYNNVIHDLFAVDVTPADNFPADDVGEGFDNIGEVLSLPPLLMEKYLEAAETVTAAVAEDPAAWQAVFPASSTDNSGLEHIRLDVTHLARRAFRRPPEEGELDRLMELFRLARDEGATTNEAVAFVTQAILVSPHFLFRLEEDPLTVDADEAKPLSSHAIASRLSFFLWSTVPDTELDRLADQKRLLDADVVLSQARRMLQHPKARALVDNFVGQWLELRLLDAAAPDPEMFPDFDESLKRAMINETTRYFEELIKNDGSILELIDSDYSYVNARLAAHYDIAGVTGNRLRRVRLQDDRRGGILTHGSILTLTSNPTRTSPVKRGKWILENILGTPPPPPPPNVAELEEGDDLLGSLRERMQQHRENPSCAVCHRKMDALGFGFENFDATGGWRERDGRYEIDASGELPGNITFQEPAELRQILRSNSDEFASCLARKLLIYCLGRTLSSRDQCVVDDVVEHLKQHGYRFSELIVAIVTSDTFRYSGKTGGEQ